MADLKKEVFLKRSAEIGTCPPLLNSTGLRLSGRLVVPTLDM